MFLALGLYTMFIALIDYTDDCIITIVSLFEFMILNSMDTKIHGKPTLEDCIFLSSEAADSSGLETQVVYASEELPTFS